MKTSLLAAIVALLLPAADFSFSTAAFAQPPGARGGGEEGQRGGRWRGERGGGERGGGERGGGSRGERGGGERGGPGGGWDRGGGERGGPPGGGPRGGRGGFDPSSMIQRMDRNNNGMLEPEEMEGPAQMMIGRLQREDPSIRTDRPVPVSKILEAFERMRGGSGGDRGSSREETQAKLNEALTPPETLVPGFGEPVVLEPVLGFGPAAELMAVTVTPEDRKSAEELLQRYDRNRDGAVSGDEISRRWPGNPMDFDRNGDGKLSLNELGIRAARLRIAEAEVQAASNRRSAPAPRPREEQPAEMPDPYNGRRSFASASRALPEGLPGWFAERDADGDQQVSMAEYSREWTASLVAEFQSFDLNGDGVITPSECLAAIRSGATASGGGASESRAGESRGFSRSRGSGGDRPTSSSPSASSPAPAATGELEPKMLETAQRIIGRNDKNGDGALTHDEWKEMLVDPTAADANQDGRITVEEYARWMQARSSR